YVGQSNPQSAGPRAWKRVWGHLAWGASQHVDRWDAKVGRFIRGNWPQSMLFRVWFCNSHSDFFGSVQGDARAAERWLIRDLRPCLNKINNFNPTPLPAAYVLPEVLPVDL